MLLPENKLLAWAALVVLPSAALIGLLPETAPAFGALLALFAAVAGADAWLAFPRLRGLAAEFPEVVRTGVGVETRLEFVLHDRSVRPGRGGLRLVALVLPPEVSSELDVLLVEPKPGQERLHVAWPCVASERGEHRLSEYRLGARSPLGWWTARRRVAASTVFRVYPNLLHERRSLASLLLNRESLGVHARRQVGQGREFEKLRDYVHGDGYENVHDRSMRLSRSSRFDAPSNTSIVEFESFDV